MRSRFWRLLDNYRNLHPRCPMGFHVVKVS